MPKYAPHTLPSDGARPGAPQQEGVRQERAAQSDTQPAQRPAQVQRTHPSIMLGQHIRRERGMQGVRSYTVAIREYLSDTEYKELCASMGVPVEARPPVQPHQHQQHMQPPPQPPPMQPQQQPPVNQGQLMQTLAQLMPLLSGGAGGGGGGNPLGQFMNNGQGGGFNPNMLSSLLGGQGNAASSGGGIDPMMLAQLFSGFNK